MKGVFIQRIENLSLGEVRLSIFNSLTHKNKGLRVFMIYLFIVFLLSGVSGELLDEDSNSILDELNSGQISVESIRVFESVSSEQQSQFVSAINNLDVEKQKTFWKSFWELSKEDRAKFINGFEGKSRNDVLNAFSDQYVKAEGRESSVLQFNLKGDVEVGFDRTSKGQEFIRLGKKLIFLDSYKLRTGEQPTYDLDYDAGTDTLVQITSETSVSGESSFSVKGGKFILGSNKFYVLDENGGVDESHALTKMKWFWGDIELDLTGEEYSLSFEDEAKGNAYVTLEDGMRLRTVKDLENPAQVVFGEDGQVKSLEDLNMKLDGRDFKVVNGKMRFVSDVDDLLDNKGGIDADKMNEFLLEGNKDSEYGGYLVYDKGEDGKAFVAVVTGSVGLGEFGSLTSEALQEKQLDTIGRLFGMDLKKQKASEVAPVLDVKKLEEIERKISTLRLATSDIGEKATGVVDFFGGLMGKEKVSARAQIDKQLKPLLGEDYEMSDVDYAVFTDSGFLDSVEETVEHFKSRLEDSNYFKNYLDGADLNDKNFVRNAKEDIDEILGVVGKLDSVYDSVIPRIEVNLGKEAVGTLVVGGNVEVYNDDLVIKENLQGVSFGAGVSSHLGDFDIDVPIDRIYTTNSDNVWEIKENAQGELEPFMVGGGKPIVEISSLDIKVKIEGKLYPNLAWVADVFLFKGSEFYGRELNPIGVSFKVSEEEKNRIEGLRGVVDSNDIRGAYEMDLIFRGDIDPSGKVGSESIINKKGADLIARGLSNVRKEIKNVVEILRILDSKTMEFELKSYVRDKIGESKSLIGKGSEESSLENSKVSFGLNTGLSLLKETSSSAVVQTGVEFLSKGYNSYESLSDAESQKVRSVLSFFGESLEEVQKGYSSGKLKQDFVAISFIKKENGDLFLRNSRGEILSIDSEIEPFVGRFIPLVASGGFRVAGNKAFDEKNYRFERGLEYFPEIPEQ